MLGIKDGWVLLAYLLCVLSAIFCVVYGAYRWNSANEPVEAADVKWAAQEDKVEENIQ